MRVWKNLFGDGSKIHADEIVYKEQYSDEAKSLNDAGVYGFANPIAKYGNIDPDTTEDFLILTNHKNKPPNDGNYSFIITVFYINRKNNRTQLSLGYGRKSMHIRYYNGTWSDWSKIF